MVPALTVQVSDPAGAFKRLLSGTEAELSFMAVRTCPVSACGKGRFPSTLAAEATEPLRLTTPLRMP
jgi:hypothetical protein